MKKTSIIILGIAAIIYPIVIAFAFIHWTNDQLRNQTFGSQLIEAIEKDCRAKTGYSAFSVRLSGFDQPWTDHTPKWVSTSKKIKDNNFSASTTGYAIDTIGTLTIPRYYDENFPKDLPSLTCMNADYYDEIVNAPKQSLAEEIWNDWTGYRD